MIRAGGLVADLTAEERAALRAGHDANAEKELRAQSAGTGSAGGFTVPVELSDQIVVAMKAWGPMYDENLCTVLNTTSGAQINIPTVDDTANTAAIRAENAAMVDDGSGDVTFAQKRLDAFVYATPFVRFSMELAQDSIFAMETMLGGLIGERLGRTANTQLTVGDGSGDPNGIVTAAGLGKTAAAAAAVTADEILDLVHSVDPAYRVSPRCRVMFNDSTLLALRKLKDGQGNYLITEAPDGSGRMRIGAVSVPYVINQAMASMGASNRFMVYGDFSKYFVRKVGSPVVGVMRERFWPDLGIAGLIRLDGELGDTAAVKALRNAAS
jgi:HK97 family phage major capsid protein